MGRFTDHRLHPSAWQHGRTTTTAQARHPSVTRPGEEQNNKRELAAEPICGRAGCILGARRRCGQNMAETMVFLGRPSLRRKEKSKPSLRESQRSQIHPKSFCCLSSEANPLFQVWRNGTRSERRNHFCEGPLGPGALRRPCTESLNGRHRC